MTSRERERRQDQDLYAMLVVLGIVGLMVMAANAMYYAGLSNSWVPMAAATVLSVTLLVYARVRKVFG
jgi:membrane protein YdbS with pleckstrin-like domain